MRLLTDQTNVMVYWWKSTSDGSKIGRVYELSTWNVIQIVTVILKWYLLFVQSTFNWKHVWYNRYFFQISISRATPWTRLNFDPSKVNICQYLVSEQ